MTAPGTPAETPETRKYDNSKRRAQAEETRARIVEAGAELLRESSIRDWQNVTVRAVADRAAVHERTVYRHFGTDKRLRDAVMEHQEVQAGVDLATVRIDELAEVAGRVLRFASNYAHPPDAPIDPTLHEADTRRKDALLRTVAGHTDGWTDRQQIRAAAVIDLIWSLSSFDRLRAAWGLEGEEAIEAIEWGVQVIVDATGADPTGGTSPITPPSTPQPRS